MALELNFIKKKEASHMEKHTLVADTYVVEDAKGLRLAGAKENGKKVTLVLLGRKGRKIDLELAEKLGLVKPAKEEKPK